MTKTWVVDGQIIEQEIPEAEIYLPRWSIESCKAYAKQLRDKTRANTAEHAAEAIEYLLSKRWVGLTDDEIKEIVGPWGDTPVKGYTRKLFDQIEAKLKEKNNG
jgi:hypothetical protein